MIPPRVCPCGKSYTMQAYDWPKNFAKRQFCSKKCKGVYGKKRPSKRKHEVKVCPQCGTEFPRAKHDHQSRWAERKFCTSFCAHVSRIGMRRDTPWRVTHGATKSQTYNIWTSMKQRCLNPKAQHYDRYGGRGITVCTRWMDFANFLSDMGEKPDGLTLDRIDNDKGYSPDNCRWATRAQQSSNTSATNFITFAGVTQSVSSWENTLGFKRGTVACRLRAGWSNFSALSTPPRPGNKPNHRVEESCAEITKAETGLDPDQLLKENGRAA